MFICSIQSIMNAIREHIQFLSALFLDKIRHPALSTLQKTRERESARESILQTIVMTYYQQLAATMQKQTMTNFAIQAVFTVIKKHFLKEEKMFCCVYTNISWNCFYQKRRKQKRKHIIIWDTCRWLRPNLKTQII